MHDGRPDSLALIKLGGSLLTDKSRLAMPAFGALQLYARLLARLAERRQEQFIVAIGGGSFGNGVAHLQPFVGREAGLAATAHLISAWSCMVQEIGSRAGLPCTSILGRELFRPVGGKRRFSTGAIAAALRSGKVPMVFGDVVPRDNAHCQLVSSDTIPILIAGELPLRRVVTLTSAPGVVVAGAVLRRVPPSMLATASAAAGSSAWVDATGGMRRKVSAARRLAYKGVEVVIADGRDAVTIDTLLDAIDPPGTLIESCAWGRAC